MGRAIVFNGNETWEEREFPVPDPPPGGAVMRSRGAGINVTRACALINEGLVPTRERLGEVFPLERFEEAFALLDRRIPGRDAVRVSLQIW